MIADLVVTSLTFILEGALAFLDSVIPSSVLAWINAAVDTLGALLQFTPVLSIAVLLGAWFAFDAAINLYGFAWNTYRLLPAKFT